MDDTDRWNLRLAWPVAAALGEGPVWIADALWFVDIKGHALHRFDPATGERRRFAMPGPIGFVLPADDGESLVAGIGTALHRIVDGQVVEHLADVDGAEGIRINDACVDPSGALWFGTMDDGERKPTGAIHRFDGHRVTRMGGECAITNGPAVTPDGQTLYHVDTIAQTIWRYAIVGDVLGDRDMFARLAPGEGYPDGVTLDAEGCVWVGLWAGHALRRYAPDGTLLASLALPVANVTKVAFGGPERRTGFVTTAHKGLSDAARSRQPLAGGLFAFDAPAPGLPSPRIKLTRKG